MAKLVENAIHPQKHYVVYRVGKQAPENDFRDFQWRRSHSHDTHQMAETTKKMVKNMGYFSEIMTGHELLAHGMPQEFDHFGQFKEGFIKNAAKALAHGAWEVAKQTAVENIPGAKIVANIHNSGAAKVKKKKKLKENVHETDDYNRGFDHGYNHKPKEKGGSIDYNRGVGAGRLQKIRERDPMKDIKRLSPLKNGISPVKEELDTELVANIKQTLTDKIAGLIDEEKLSLAQQYLIATNQVNGPAGDDALMDECACSPDPDHDSHYIGNGTYVDDDGDEDDGYYYVDDNGNITYSAG